MAESSEIWSHPVRLADLAKRRATSFELVPDAATRKGIAAALGIDALRKLRFSGTLTPQGRQDWALSATLGATGVQPCVVTLAPVTSRIDTQVIRHYMAELPDLPEGGETEMSGDDNIEPLPATLDLGAVMVESLALALPDFPRAEGVELGTAVFTEPGRVPMQDEDARPFAGLRDAMAGKPDNQD